MTDPNRNDRRKLTASGRFVPRGRGRTPAVLFSLIFIVASATARRQPLSNSVRINELLDRMDLILPAKVTVGNAVLDHPVGVEPAVGDAQVRDRGRWPAPRPSPPSWPPGHLPSVGREGNRAAT